MNYLDLKNNNKEANLEGNNHLSKITQHLTNTSRVILNSKVMMFLEREISSSQKFSKSFFNLKINKV
jgi:hypothetical protein